MIWRRVEMRLVLALVFVLSIAWATRVSVASATEGPWWGLTSGSRPTNLRHGVGADEVQEVKVSATGGDVVIVEPVSLEEEFRGEGSIQLATFEFDAPAGEVQAAFESLYGAGNVEVSGGPGDATGSKPYIVTYTGGLSDQPVALVNTAFSPLLGLEGTATATEKTAGKPDGEIVLSAENRGDADASGAGESIVVHDKLPSKIKAVSAEAVAGGNVGESDNRGPVECAVATVTCVFKGTLAPYEAIEMRVGVVVEEGASASEENEMDVSGAGAANASLVRPLRITSAAEAFGIENFELIPEEPGGAVSTQAGSHPFQLTGVLSFDQTSDADPTALPKDLHIKLPPGLIGNPTPLPQCTMLQFDTGENGFVNECPSDSAIGVANVTINEPEIFHGVVNIVVPLFNLTPALGEPARFGFLADGFPVIFDTEVRTGEDYGVTVNIDNITQTAAALSSKVTFWGVPGDPRHDNARGWNCVRDEYFLTVNSELPPCAHADQQDPPPFLSLPTSCESPYVSTVEADSWAEPKPADVPTGSYHLQKTNGPSLDLDGCNRLSFRPSIEVTPDSSAASTPTGLLVKVHVDQEAALDPTGLAQSAVKDTVVKLPPGLTINPGGADGLEACSMSQIGYLAGESSGNNLKFTPEQPACPNGSKIGTVEIETPLLPNKLEGAVYLGTQNENPFGSLIAMYIVASDPVSGTLVKLPGEVSLDQATGQLTSTFKNTLELPFEDLRLHFFGGARAPLSTPPLCGSYRTDASFTPWSGNPAVNATSELQIAPGPNGSPCANPRPFSPGFTAGTTSVQAGGLTPFTTSLNRPDADQPLGALSMTLPPGLLGSLSAVKLCPEPQAQLGQCGPESLIGHTVVSAGLGSNPVTVKREGEVFITGPYKGAPYGLSIVNPAEAGPFNLGNVIVRAKVEVDPHTAQLKVTSDAFPTILQGIPLQLQHINVTIDRPGFTFNPTNCSKMAISGTIASAEGSTASASSPFQVTNCAALPFKPKFTATTRAHHTRKDGAYLQVHVTSGSGQADIAKAKVELPKALPSELKTLQKACTEAQFDANPAGCPEESQVGTVLVHTPVLPVPLTGPAYFVSRGTQWPELIMVLQGYGVTVDLAGETHISKQGVTSTTLGSVPDVPFTSFTLTLPEGSHSALAANGNLCKKTLIMPTKLTGQNGALVEQSTKIKVRGCSAARKRRKGGTHKRRHKHKGRHRRHAQATASRT